MAIGPIQSGNGSQAPKAQKETDPFASMLTGNRRKPDGIKPKVKKPGGPSGNNVSNSRENTGAEGSQSSQATLGASSEINSTQRS